MSQFRRTSIKVIPIESWLQFDDEPMVQERQQVKDHQSCISVFVAYPTIPSSNNMTTVFHVWSYGRFIEIQSNLRIKKCQRMNQGSNFLRGSFSNRELQSNLEEKVNPTILKDEFSSRRDPSIFTSIPPGY